MAKSDPERESLEKVIEHVKHTHFIPEYQEQATDAECLGVALAHYFGWQGTPILEACYSGLEDGNYHTLNEVIEILKNTHDTKRMAHALYDWAKNILDKN